MNPKTKQRTAIGALGASAALLVALATHEGFSEKAYPDPTRGTALPTVGFGSTGPDITMSTRMNPVQALQRTLTDVQRFEGALKKCVNVPLHQAEYDLYLSLSYNIGPSAFCKSGIVRELNSERYMAACENILKWRFSNGQDCSDPANRSCRGLWTRRKSEHAACMAAQG